MTKHLEQKARRPVTQGETSTGIWASEDVALPFAKMGRYIYRGRKVTLKYNPTNKIHFCRPRGRVQAVVRKLARIDIIDPMMQDSVEYDEHLDEVAEGLLRMASDSLAERKMLRRKRIVAKALKKGKKLGSKQAALSARNRTLLSLASVGIYPNDELEVGGKVYLVNSKGILKEIRGIDEAEVMALQDRLWLGSSAVRRDTERVLDATSPSQPGRPVDEWLREYVRTASWPPYLIFGGVVLFIYHGAYRVLTAR